MTDLLTDDEAEVLGVKQKEKVLISGRCAPVRKKNLSPREGVCDSSRFHS